MKINKPLVRRWIKALRSGEYDQCRGYLGQHDPKNDTDSFCCLGVLCVVEGFEATEWHLTGDDTYNLRFHNPDPNVSADQSYVLPSWSKAGLTDSQTNALTDMNDIERLSFEQIAQHLKGMIS